MSIYTSFATISRSRSSNKVPPGAVNLERSYQICQAVIQNSPNRDALRGQLRPPPALLTRVSRAPRHHPPVLLRQLPVSVMHHNEVWTASIVCICDKLYCVFLKFSSHWAFDIRRRWSLCCVHISGIRHMCGRVAIRDTFGRTLMLIEALSVNWDATKGFEQVNETVLWLL